MLSKDRLSKDRESNGYIEISKNEIDIIKKLDYKKEDIFVVVQCFVDMLSCNIDYGDNNIGEYFNDWCEKGKVFYNSFESESLTAEQEKQVRARIEIMKLFCKYANGVSDFLLLLYNNKKD